MKQLIKILLAAVLTFNFVLGGSTPAPTIDNVVITTEESVVATEPAATEIAATEALGDVLDVLGHYVGVGSEVNGIKLESTGEWIQLDANYRGIFFILGNEYPFDWKLEGDQFSMDQDVGISYTGTLSGDELVINAAGMTYFFSKGTAEVTVETTKTQAATVGLPADVIDFWNRDWYGYWYTDNLSGEEADFYDSWWDICLRINVDQSGKGTMIVWDELYSATDPWGEVAIQINLLRGEAGVGVVEVVDGLLNFGDEDMSAVGWILDPSEWLYSDTIGFEGVYVGEKVSFDYYSLLRPWGRSWDDIESDFPDGLPYAYHDWYLPLIQEGKPMPDEINMLGE